MAKLAASALPDWPAAMNQQMAAAYCGISVDTFSAVCPVIPIVITSSNAGKRYLRVRLDEWLLSLDNPRPQRRLGVGERLRAQSEAQRA
ncbi:hypothetical protein [Devosia submarina]|uniref:hypothetical protein n=1 Tax=Devosia submarina TaxID=1173082 RepID=UPI000D3967AE|nr:hypothetical protein [Devosia submarina]